VGSIGETLTRRQALGRIGTGAVAAALTGLPSASFAAAAAAGSPQPTRLTLSLRSSALRGLLRFAVYLPASYATSTERYPVVYFLHGLPANPGSYLGLNWVAQALAQSGRDAVLVTPQGTHTAGGDPEYHDWGPGDDWETAIARDLPAWIDARYRTVAKRSGRAIVGYSAGGYGASIIGLHHPETFAAIQSWSGYFEPTDPTGSNARSVGSAAANARAQVATLVPALRTQFERFPTSFAFYVGNTDPTFVPANISLQQELARAGVDHLFRLYPGGHTQGLWQSHAPAWLGLAVDSLTGSATL
jgi:enterochelin esterase-like enzyme